MAFSALKRSTGSFYPRVNPRSVYEEIWGRPGRVVRLWLVSAKCVL